MKATAFLLAVAFLAGPAPGSEVVVSVKRQMMTLLDGRDKKAEFPVSTSKFGVGDQFRSFRTPVGVFQIERKVGDHLPVGAVLKGLHFTGEVVSPDAAGRDPIVTRVLCLRGVAGANNNAAARGIYIHGTPEEKNIGKPASYGCIRMRSRDVITLFERVPVGTRVTITDVPATGSAGRAAVAASDTRGDDWYR